tara:strand:+ start:120 stop:581 length:462 start_codon:yes stop_codon:yes gene_type:complete
MGHWARIDDDGIVQEVIVIKKEMLDTGAWGDPSKWIKTSYNTHYGVHYVPSEGQNYSVPSEDQSKALGYRFAGKGMKYDSVNDVFYNPSPPFSSWVFDSTKWEWKPPINIPADDGSGKIWVWDEKVHQADTGDPKTKGWVDLLQITNNTPYDD